MSLLVTGATGCLGPFVVERLLAEGHEVAVLSRRPFRAHALFGERVRLHEWHPWCEPIPPDAFEGTTAVLHLMSEPLAGGTFHERARLVLDSRRNGTQRVIDGIGDRNIRLVVASLAMPPEPERRRGGGDPDRSDITEATPASGTPGARERDVLAWEGLALSAAERGVSVAVVRLGLVTAAGPGLERLVELGRLGIKLDLRGARIPAIDPNDAAALLSGLLQSPELTGLILGVAPLPIEGEALMAVLAGLSRFPLPGPVPVRLLRHRLGLMSSLLDNRRRMVPERLTSLGADFASPNPLLSLTQAIAKIADTPRPPPVWMPPRPARPATEARGETPKPTEPA